MVHMARTRVAGARVKTKKATIFASAGYVESVENHEGKINPRGFPGGSTKCTRYSSQHVACSAGVFFGRAICSPNRHVETSRREKEMGRVKGGGEREEKTPARKHCENEKHPLIRRA